MTRGRVLRLRNLKPGDTRSKGQVLRYIDTLLVIKKHASVGKRSLKEASGLKQGGHFVLSPKRGKPKGEYLIIERGYKGE